MFKKTFFVAALAFASVSALSSAQAATPAETDLAISSVSGCEASSCVGLVQAALAAANSLPDGAEKDALLQKLIAAVAAAGVANPEIAGELSALAESANGSLSAEAKAAAATAATETTAGASTDSGASHGEQGDGLGGVDAS